MPPRHSGKPSRQDAMRPLMGRFPGMLVAPRTTTGLARTPPSPPAQAIVRRRKVGARTSRDGVGPSLAHGEVQDVESVGHDLPSRRDSPYSLWGYLRRL